MPAKSTPSIIVPRHDKNHKDRVSGTSDETLSKKRTRSARRGRRKEKVRLNAEQKQEHFRTETSDKQADSHAQCCRAERSVACSNGVMPEPARRTVCELGQLRKEDNILLRGGSNEQIRPASCSLSAEQLQVLRLVLSGVNVFYTGGAGTDKSTVLRALVEELRLKGRRVQVVTPTGISALNVSGSTYFTWAGWSPGIIKVPIDEVRSMAMSKQRRLRLRGTDVLIIDEISMIEANQFRRLDRGCRTARDCDAAFGGMQVVVTGDFYQLPPVKALQTCFKCGTELRTSAFCIDCRPHAGAQSSQSACPKVRGRCRACGLRPCRWSDCPSCGALYDMDDQWAFRSDTWDGCEFQCITLAEVHRQNDQEFIEILNTLRAGERLHRTQLALLNEQQNDIGPAIELSALRSTVDQKNTAGLQAISGALRAYSCDYYVHIQPNHPHLAFMAEVDADGNRVGCREYRFTPTLETKYGMPVVLLANIDIGAGLVNGSQGHIIGYVSVGSAMDKRKHRLARAGEFNQPQEGQIMRWIAKQSTPLSLPIVQFENGLREVIHPVCQGTELGDPRPFSTVARTEIPLLSAWAITIHKSQGMTLERVVVNLDEVFEPQMAYVALSRARGLSGLKVLSRVSVDDLQEQGRLGGCSSVVKDFMEKQFGHVARQEQSVPGRRYL